MSFLNSAHLFARRSISAASVSASSACGNARTAGSVSARASARSTLSILTNGSGSASMSSSAKHSSSTMRLCSFTRSTNRCFHSTSLISSPCPHCSSSVSSADYSHINTSVPRLHATTILTVRKGGSVIIIGDGQATLGHTVAKSNVRKIRVVDNGRVLIGFAGSVADCFSLMDKLEKKLEEYPGQLLRAAVELAKEWRTDKYLRQLEAQMIAVDKDISVTIAGNGDVMSDPGFGIMGIGSGGNLALAAARALISVEEFTARQIAVRAMNIAADMCIYTNHNFVLEAFETEEDKKKNAKDPILSQANPIPNAAGNIPPPTNAPATPTPIPTPQQPQPNTPTAVATADTAIQAAGSFDPRYF